MKKAILKCTQHAETFPQLSLLDNFVATTNCHFSNKMFLLQIWCLFMHVLVAINTSEQF